jgi:hypothetical protein
MNMKVVCIRVPHTAQSFVPPYIYLIKNRIYDVDINTLSVYRINGYWESKSNFITLEEYRDAQLMNIL